MRDQILSLLRRAMGTSRLQGDVSALRAEMEAHLALRRAWQAERDATMVELGAVRAALQAADQTRAEALEAARIAAHHHTQGVIAAMLNAARPGSFVHLELNGAPLDVPVETLRTMFHCIHVRPDRSLYLLVETAHLNWMLDRLAPGGTFLDVGASTGATALPAAHRFGSQLRVIAYEPATAARGLLEATVARNGLSHLEVRPFAVSDKAGEAEFREYLPDETGQTPWTPEASSLVASVMPDLPSRMVRVGVVTLDEQMAEAGDFPGPVVVKIDVEGFEAFVLRGAAEMIRIVRPYFSIDIHGDPFATDGSSTEAAVRAILAPAGYRFSTLGHVLLCEPG
jgi:FkbM family methyltransferase